MRLNEISGGAQGLLARQHLALVESCLAAMAKQLQAMGEAHDPKELVTRQAELAAEWREALLAMGEQVTSADSEAEPGDHSDGREADDLNPVSA